MSGNKAMPPDGGIIVLLSCICEDHQDSNDLKHSSIFFHIDTLQPSGEKEI